MSVLRQIADGRTDLIIDYIKNGGRPQDKNHEGQPLIVTAAYYGDVTAVKYLIELGASLDSIGSNYDLNGAAFHGHWQLCQFLLEQRANPNFRLSHSGESPLHSCLSKANNPRTLFIVKLLLAYKADVNATTLERKETGAFMRDAYTYGETPLHRAAAFGTADIIRTLIEHGADKSAKDMNGNSPLSWASWHLRPGEILSLLTHSDHTIHPLHVKRIRSDHGAGYGAGTMSGLIGEIHLPD